VLKGGNWLGGLRLSSGWLPAGVAGETRVSPRVASAPPKNAVKPKRGQLRFWNVNL
jgi:hypothetical protein